MSREMKPGKKINPLWIIILAIVFTVLYSKEDLIVDRNQEQITVSNIEEVPNISEDKEQVSVLGFRNENLLEDHFEKHGKEMGFDSAKEYEDAAIIAATNPKALHKLESEDQDHVYYVEDTNEFVIVSPAGYIRTYYYPRDGIDYFNRQ